MVISFDLHTALQTGHNSSDNARRGVSKRVPERASHNPVSIFDITVPFRRFIGEQRGGSVEGCRGGWRGVAGTV